MSLENCNYTQVPNVILENLGELKPAELKVILTITRWTLGWHRRTCKMSISYLMAATALSNRAVITACRELCNRDWVERSEAFHEGRITHEYTLKLEAIPPQSTCEKSSQVPVKKVHTTYEESSQVPVKKVHTTKERTKEKDLENMSPEGDEPPTPSKTETIPEGTKAKKAPAKKKQVTAESLLAKLTPEKAKVFSDWWNWYRGACNKLGSASGSKAAAAKVWVDMVDDLNIATFKRGCSLWLKDAIAKEISAPHGHTFLAGKKAHPDPYWQAAIDNASAADEDSQFLSDVKPTEAENPYLAVSDIISDEEATRIRNINWWHRTDEEQAAYDLRARVLWERKEAAKVQGVAA